MKQENKETDLMIGDWIENPLGLKGQIKSIKYSGHGYIVEISFGEGSDQCFPIEDVRPIPLTPEILEKNGFDSDNNIFGLCNYELSSDLILENRGDRFCLVRRGHGSSTYWILALNYVHELQHCLRFFRIDKDIRL